MGTVPSTPRWGMGVKGKEAAEYLIGTFVNEKSYPIGSDYWNKLLELRFSHYWHDHRLLQACHVFSHNNCYTRHLAKILIHLQLSLQDCSSTADVPPSAYAKAVNATYISSVFLKYLIENAKSDNFEEFYLSVDESEAVPSNFPQGQNIGKQVMTSVLSFIGNVEVSSNTSLLHHELLNFMLVAMSTQLRSGPSPGPKDVHPFIDSTMVQENTLVGLVVQKLLLNYIVRPQYTLKSASFDKFSEGNAPSVLQRAANFVLLPFNYLVGSSNEASRSSLAESSLHLLLILIHFRKCVLEETDKDGSIDHSASDYPIKENTYFAENPFCNAIENARDTELDRVDIEGNVHIGPLVRVPFAALFDTLGMYLADETSVLLLYSLVYGNSNFLEYVLVRTDLDTLLMPMLETLYNASKRSSNQIYMVLIILLILSQDSSFNASIHKLMLPSVPWYQERLLHQTSLGSLMVVVLIRTVKYNLSKLRCGSEEKLQWVDFLRLITYQHKETTNCLAALANMAPHVHLLSAYASQGLVSLFYMLSRKYTKLAERKNDGLHIVIDKSREADSLAEDLSTELHIYTDFLRIVLEILNAILTYALPRNPEVVYAIMHRQEVFQPFKTHPRFNELLQNIYTVLDFFNNRMDAHKVDGEWSVKKVLEVIIINCRSWRGDGMKMFNQLRFTYEQESHHEEFFIPYVWQLVTSRSALSFYPSSINLFSIDLPLQEGYEEEEYEGEAGKIPNGSRNGDIEVELLKAP